MVFVLVKTRNYIYNNYIHLIIIWGDHMEILKDKQENTLTITLTGRLDTVTAPQLEEVVSKELADVKDLKLDLTNLEYVSSAGLRVFLAAQKLMNQQGKMAIINANDSIKEIFEITGFIDILTIK